MKKASASKFWKDLELNWIFCLLTINLILIKKVNMLIQKVNILVRKVLHNVFFLFMNNWTKHLNMNPSLKQKKGGGGHNLHTNF